MEYSPQTLATTSTLLQELTKVAKPIFLDVLAKRDERIQVLEKRLKEIYKLVIVQRDTNHINPFLRDEILQLSKPEWYDLPFQEVPEELGPIIKAHLDKDPPNNPE